MGSGIGGMIFTPLVSSLISNQGWRFSFRVAAVVVAVVTLVVTALVRRSPAEMGQAPLTSADGQQAADPKSKESTGMMKMATVEGSPLRQGAGKGS